MSPLRATWSKIPTAAKAHLPRSSHSVCLIGSKAYIFGGEIQPRQPVDNAVHVVDVATGEYTSVQAAGDAPAPRVGHTGVAIGTDIYVFGGRGGKDMTPLEESGAVYVFSTTAQTWSKRLPGGSTPNFPKPRSYHSATASSSYIIIHGGCPPPPSGRLSDVWAFNTASSTWTQLPDAPGKGRGGTAIAVLGDKLWRFGGFDGVGEQGGGINALNLAPSSESKDTAAEGPGARSVTALIASKQDKLLAIMGEGKPSPTGGHDTAGGFYDDAWSFDPATGVWQEVQTGAGPGARGWFGADAYEGGAVVWGGLNGANERKGDGWVLSLD